MASRYEISAVFRMIDNLTAPVQRMSNSTMTASKRMQMEMEKTKMKIKAVGQAMATAGKLALAAGVALAGKTVVDSIKTYIEFEDAVTKAGSKFKDLDVTSADYQDNLENLQKAAREVGAATMFSATDAAGALDKMAMAGLTSKQSMGMLMGTTNLAVAAGIDLTSAVDMATDAMGAFNLMKDKETGELLDEKGIAGSMNRIADVVAKTTNMANTDMEMWFEAVKMGAPTFNSMGGTIEEFSALVGVLANSGMKGSIAGNAIKNMMLKLSAPAKDGALSLKEFGVNVFDAQGKMLPFIDIMKQFEGTFNKGTFTNLTAYENALKEATKKGGKGAASVRLEDFIEDTNDLNKLSRLKDIFGTEWIGAFNILLAEGSAGIEKFTEDLKKAGGTAEAIAGAQMNSFSGMIEQLKSAWQDKQLSIGKAFETGGAKEALQSLITYVQNLDITPIVSFLQRVMEALPSIVSNIGSVISFIWGIKDAIFAVMAGVTAYKTVMVALVAIQTARNALALVGIGQTTAMTAATTAQTTATTAATAAQTGLNVAMAANPIGLIITGIIAATAAISFGIYELVKHWETVKEFFANVWEKIKWLGSVIADFFTGIWNGIVNFFSALPSYLSSIFSTIYNAILNFLFGENASAVDNFLSNIFTSIGNFFVNVFTSIGNFFASIFSAVGEFFSSIWNKVTEIAIAFKDIISNFFSWIFEIMQSAFATIYDFFSPVIDFFIGIAETIKNIFFGCIDSVLGFWEVLTNAFKHGGLIGAIAQIGKSILSFLISPVIKALDLMSGIPGIGDWIGGKRDALIAFQNSLTDTIVEANTPQTNQLGADFDYYKSLGWDTEDDGLPPTVSPITQGERTAYSVTESNNNTSTEVTVTLDKGLQGSVSRPAPNVTVKNTRSGSW